MTQLGKYILHEEIGRGGFGIVYRATDTSLGRDVALKVLHPQLTIDPDFLEKFQNEARLVAALDSRDIVTVYELGEVDARTFIAMRLLPGGSLSERLKEGKPLPFDKACDIIRQVCAGLHQAHQKGLVHRDIKPGNILFDEKGNAVIGDFGLARAIQRLSDSIRGSFGAVGTPAYRAPELWEGMPPADETTDIYSLGCVFAEMLSGQVLFDGETNNVIINKHLNHAPSIPDGLPKEIVSVIKKALAKTQRDRYESTMTFSAAIAIAQAKIAKAQSNGEQFQRSLLAARDSLKEVEESTAKLEGEGGQDRKRIAALRAEANGLQKELERLKAPLDHPDQPPRKGIIYAAAAAALLLVGFLIIRFVPFTPSAPQPEDTSTPLPVAAVQKTATPKAKKTTAIVPTKTPIPTPALGIGSTKKSEKDGMVMVYVPAGKFEMGSEEGEENEKPQHTVYLDAYYIDQTEVSNAQYMACVKAGACVQPADTAYYNSDAFADHPIVNVSWYNADDYCEWAGRQLPTEAQWEKAARGTDGRTYPWGEGFDCSFANFFGCTDYQTSSVGYYGKKGASPYGAYDMAGNVWELVADWYDRDYYRNSPSSNPTGPSNGTYRVVRGGSYYRPSGDYFRLTVRENTSPFSAVGIYGFRCAMDADSEVN